MKIKYKEYPRVYERVFTSKECLEKFSLNQMTTDYSGGKEEIVDIFGKFFRRTSDNLYRTIFEYSWLQRRFLFKGLRKHSYKRAFIKTDTAYSNFIKHYIGSNYQMMTSNPVFGKIYSYLKDFFKNIDKCDPISRPEDFDFPYKHIDINYLILVYQMDERMDLLNKAEKEKMSLYEFMDFLINYTNCVNDEKGKTVYEFIKSSSDRGIYYVKKVIK